MEYFAVIDTETNWKNQVMSIGVVIAQWGTFRAVDARYHVLAPEFKVGGMFSQVLFDRSQPRPRVCGRGQAMEELLAWLGDYGVTDLFAYNAAFDHKLLPELKGFRWYDIMRLAAYRQYNGKIPAAAECCSTGRLKRGYGVEPMLRLLSGDRTYRELHHALRDAVDELEIMRLLGHPREVYIEL